MERKCAECKQTFEVNRSNVDEVIRFEGLHYHHDCFLNTCKRKSKRSNALPKWGEALENFEYIKKETTLLLDRELCKDEIYNFILDNYDLKIVPSYIFQKLEDIYNGRWKGMSCGIPPEDILDMWQRKIGYLNKIRAKNITLGKDMDSVQQVNYDISVLINKYDSYLKWKEQNKIIEQEVNQVHKEILKTVDLDKLSKMTQSHQQDEDNDMDSLLEELFG